MTIYRVLNGEQPEELLAQQVTKLELVINIEKAKALGPTIPPWLLARAEEAFESIQPPFTQLWVRFRLEM